jgi:hypothetical protein
LRCSELKENMSKLLLVLLLTFFQTHGIKEVYYSKTQESYENVDGTRQLVGQTITTFRKSDDNPVVKLVRIFNYKDDPRIYQLSGLKKENGLSDYTLDSIFYDRRGNDTLKVSYISTGGKWVKTMSYKMRFRPDNAVYYAKMEKHNDPKFTNETFYKYNAAGKVISETEYRCSVKSPCDSTYKKLYYYSEPQHLDSISNFTWENRKWQRVPVPERKQVKK